MMQQSLLSSFEQHPHVTTAWHLPSGQLSGSSIVYAGTAVQGDIVNKNGDMFPEFVFHPLINSLKKATDVILKDGTTS